MVAADRAAHLERPAPDVEALEGWDLAGQGYELLRDVLEILQLAREPLQFLSGLRFVYEHGG